MIAVRTDAIATTDTAAGPRPAEMSAVVGGDAGGGVIPPRATGGTLALEVGATESLGAADSDEPSELPGPAVAGGPPPDPPVAGCVGGAVGFGVSLGVALGVGLGVGLGLGVGGGIRANAAVTVALRSRTMLHVVPEPVQAPPQ